MPDLSKIVTDRLRAAARAVDHPDGDVLTAFSEQALPARERAVVLEHLARCGDCREVVALALPDAQTVDRVVPPVSRGWLSWPVLRWGFVGVGVVAIASLGIVRYQSVSNRASSKAASAQFEPFKKDAQNVPPPNPTSPETAVNLKAPAAALPASSANQTKPRSVDQEFARLERYDQAQTSEARDNPARENKNALAVLGSHELAQLQHGPRVQYQSSFQNNSQNNIANRRSTAAQFPSPKQPPNAFVAADVSAPAASLTSAQSQPGPRDVPGNHEEALVLQNTMPLKPIEGGQGQVVERAKGADGLAVSWTAKVPSGAIASPPAASAFALAPPNVSWTIIAGGLQRSFDQGKTWQNVSVNPVPPAGASFGYGPQKVEAKVADDKNGGGAKPATNLPVFRAVVANGADVWAGGSSGSLYHSTDSGAHWARVLPFSGTTILTGDIVSLEFPDAQHGRILTSTPEVWLTSDGGQIWQKQ